MGVSKTSCPLDGSSSKTELCVRTNLSCNEKASGSFPCPPARPPGAPSARALLDNSQDPPPMRYPLQPVLLLESLAKPVQSPPPKLREISLGHLGEIFSQYLPQVVVVLFGPDARVVLGYASAVPEALHDQSGEAWVA